MPAVASFYHDGEKLYDAEGYLFDPATITFQNVPRAIDRAWTKMTGREAVMWLQKGTGRIRPPVGVIGPREASDQDRGRAYIFGRELASVGLTVLCGGRQGVMEAVCKGVAEAGGLSIGLLPESDWKCGNQYVGVPLSTGIGIARNALIACSAHVLVAIGTGLGTLSEMALGLQFGKRVFALAGGDINIPGVETYTAWEALEPHFYEAVLNWRCKDNTGNTN